MDLIESSNFYFCDNLRNTPSLIFLSAREEFCFSIFTLKKKKKKMQSIMDKSWIKCRDVKFKYIFNF